MAQEVTVVGAVNVDMNGTPSAPLIMRDSNPGRIHISFGGVGRNIAENLCRLGAEVELITALGEDMYAQGLRDHCRRAGIGLTHAKTVPGGRTSTYLCINDARGDMALAVSDMEIYTRLTPDYLAQKLPVIQASRLVVLDTNLSAEAIAFLAERCTAPILADPVSVHKGQKLLPVLSRIHTIKPNLLEAEALSGVRIETKESLEAAGRRLLALGLKNVFLSLGKDGIYYTNGREAGIVPCYPADMVNTTGCGDACTAAIAKGLLLDKPIGEIARLGMAAAAVCIARPDTISPELSMERIQTILNENGGHF